MVMVTPASVKAARKVLGWSQQRLANYAGIGLETLAHFEAGCKSRAKTVEAIASALDRADNLRAGRVTFDENIKSPHGLGDAEVG